MTEEMDGKATGSADQNARDGATAGSPPPAEEKGVRGDAQEAADEENEKIPEVTYEIEDSGPCQKRFKVRISQHDSLDSMERAFDELTEDVIVPGFRPGRAPRWLLEKRFGKQVRQEVKGRLLQVGMEQSLKRCQLKTIGVPELDAKAVEFDPSKDFCFEFKAFVRPEFDLPEYHGLDVEVPALDVTEAMVDQYLQRRMSGESRLIEAPAGDVAKDDDLVECDAELMESGSPIWAQTQLRLLLSPTARYRLVVPEMIDLATGATAGDEKTMNVRLSDAFPEVPHRGKEVVLKLKVKGVKKRIYPELTDERVQRLRYESLAAARARVRDEMEKENERVVNMVVESTIQQKLLAMATFELPEPLIAKYVDSRVAERRRELEGRQAGEEEMTRDLNRVREESREGVTREIKWMFLLQRICEKEGLDLGEGDLDDRIGELAKEQKRDPFELREEYEENGQLDLMREEMLRTRALDVVKRTAVIVPKGAQPEGEGATGVPQPSDAAGGDSAAGTVRS
jgi:trigger factor